MERECSSPASAARACSSPRRCSRARAMLEGREVMFLGLYGGMMRGGNTDSTVVVADAPIEAPPVVSHTWSAIAMHDEFWEPVEAKLRPGRSRARERLDVHHARSRADVDGAPRRRHRRRDRARQLARRRRW